MHCYLQSPNCAVASELHATIEMQLNTYLSIHILLSL